MGIGKQGYGAYGLPLIRNLRCLGHNYREAHRREKKKTEKRDP